MKSRQNSSKSSEVRLATGNRATSGRTGRTCPDSATRPPPIRLKNPSRSAPPNRSASLARFGRLGLEAPDSHRLTVCWLTPSRFATSACVRPDSSRASSNNHPNSYTIRSVPYYSHRTTTTRYGGREEREACPWARIAYARSRVGVRATRRPVGKATQLTQTSRLRSSRSPGPHS